MKSTCFYAETNAANGKDVACSVSTPSKVFGGMSFILFLFISLLSFTATAQNFTEITLPYNDICTLQSDGDGDSRSAYFKVTLSTSSHLHFKINEFIGSSSSSNQVSYALYKNQELTQEVLSGWLYEGDDVVTESLAAGTYYLKWHSYSFPPPFSWTMKAIEPSKIKEFRTISYSDSFILGKNTGKLSQSEATMVYIGSDYTNEDDGDGDVSVDPSGGMDITLAKGFTFKAEGGKVYKITMQGVRKNPTNNSSLVVVFLTGGRWSTPSQDMRGSFGGEFNRGKTTLHAIAYFRPTKTEDLRVLVNYEDISDEVNYAIQIEEAIVQNTSITFENITLPFEEDVTFKADNSTSYRGERIRGYKFTLNTDATVYFYGHNTVYDHQPSMVIRSREFSAEEIDRHSSLYPQQLSAGTHYVAFTDRGFYRDDYFTTRLKISLTPGEPSAPSPTVGTYASTPLITLLNNAAEVTAGSLPHTAIGSFAKGSSALVPAQTEPEFKPGQNNSGSFFSLAKKITVAAGENILVELKYWGKEKPASDNSGSEIEPSTNVSPRLFLYSKEAGDNYQFKSESSESILLGGEGITYWIVATCFQAFDEGNYRLNIRASGTNPPAKPAINSVTVSPTTIDIPPATPPFEKEILLTQLTVKGRTNDGETFTLPNTGAHWTIVDQTATYTTKNAETNDYTISAGLTGTVTFNVLSTSYTVTFNANGGSGNMNSQTIYPGQSLSANTFTNSGQTFNYWTTESNGSGTKYTNGQVVTLTGNLTLYAQWTAPVTLPTITFGEVTNITGSSATLHATINPGTVTPTEYGFTLCCGDGDGRIPVTPQGNQLTHNATGLSENQGYEVNAYYVYNGTTYRSDNFTFFRTLRAPTEINNLSHDNVTHNSATFSVNIFEGTEEPVIDRKFQYRNVEESEWTDVPGGTGTSTFTVTATGLTPGTFYVYRAVVTVTGNVEKISGENSFETLRATTEIDDIKVSNITGTTAKLTANIYEGPEEPITGRKFQYKNVEESEWTDVPGGTGTSTFTATATGLTPGTGYTARAVVTVTGGGEKTNMRPFTTLAAGVVPATATTLDATGVTKNTARLNGTITDGTQMVSSRAFEYRKEGETNWLHEGTSGTTGNVTLHLTNLNASTTYEFRLLLLAEGERVEGEIFTFTTLADEVITLAATAVTQTSAKLNGTINAGTETVTDRKFEYRIKNSTWSTITATGTTTVSANITGLTASTTYEFRLMIKANGVTKRGNLLTFITPATGVTPATATTLDATGVTKNSATLNGTINAGTETVTDHKFEYRIKNSTWSTITATGTATVSANVTGLVSSRDYQCRLVITADGRRVVGNIVDFRIPSENYVKQTVETGAVTEVTKNSAKLNGKVTAGSEPITARGFEYKAKSSTTWQKAILSSDGSITAMITDLTADTEYKVRAYATTGVEAITGNVVTFTTAKEESTGITKENLLLTLYPNPATTVLNINNIEQTKATSIEVFDISGRLLLQTPAAAVIDISTLPQGVYTVKAGNYTAKMMKR